MGPPALRDEDYPTPRPRLWVRLAELPLAAIGWALDRLLGRAAILRALRSHARARAARSSR